MGLDAEIRHENVIHLRSGVVLIHVSRHPTLGLEKVVRVAINFICRRGGKPDYERIKVIKNRSVLFENGAMCLITYHKVKVTTGK